MKELLDTTRYVIGNYVTRFIAFECSSTEAMRALRDYYAVAQGVVPNPALCVYTREEWLKEDQRMQHLTRVLSRVTYHESPLLYVFYARRITYKTPSGGYKAGHLIWATYGQPDINTNTGVRTKQTTRKWYISEHATDSEVLQTALKCILTSAEHRVREHFLVDGVRVYGPHFDVDRLVDVCINDGALSVRGVPVKS